MLLCSNDFMKRKDRFEGIILKWRLFEIMPKDMSQEKLAEMLECSAATISAVKSGKRNPDARWIEVIAEKFKIPTWQLFVDPKKVIPEEYIEIIEGYKCLDKERKILVDDMLTAARHRSRQPPSPKKTNSG